MMYLDPPYMTQGEQLYNHFMEYEDYVEMRDMLKDCKADWIISHDNNPDFEKLYEGWADITTVEGVPYTINSIKNNRKIELLITNRR